MSYRVLRSQRLHHHIKSVALDCSAMVTARRMCEVDARNLLALIAREAARQAQLHYNEYGEMP